MHVVRITPKRSLSTSPVAKLENSNTLMTLTQYAGRAMLTYACIV